MSYCPTGRRVFTLDSVYTGILTAVVAVEATVVTSSPVVASLPVSVSGAVEEEVVVRAVVTRFVTVGRCQVLAFVVVVVA